MVTRGPEGIDRHTGHLVRRQDQAVVPLTATQILAT